ncbi:hypothetical protein [Agaribacterium haliotis]|uniref:hypothetical protein n=1 Tax=Agaribacterium haliotis TaxID=2013869 RepID=UPI0011773A57|nr:hypothetical protein [Agaribacterium haliotis]
MRAALVFIFLPFFLLLAACTKQQWYGGAQSNQRQQCLAEPDYKYDTCMQRANIDYQEYQRLRASLYEDDDSAFEQEAQ